MSDRKALETVERCETCRFWLRNPDFRPPAGDPDMSSGVCRRGLRHVNRTWTDEHGCANGDWTWPPHDGRDWCGEWKAKPSDNLPDFQQWLSARSARVRKCIDRESVTSFAEMFAIKPGDMKNLGVSGYTEIVRALRLAGVKPPEEWVW